MIEVHKNAYSVINILNTIGYIHRNIDKWLCTITYELCTKILGESGCHDKILEFKMVYIK